MALQQITEGKTGLEAANIIYQNDQENATAAANALSMATGVQPIADAALTNANAAQQTASEAMIEAISKAPKTDKDGNEVVYAPKGIIEIPEGVVISECGEKANYTLAGLKQYDKLNTSLHGGTGAIITEIGSQSVVMVPLLSNETYYISLGDQYANWPYHLYRSTTDATSYFKQEIGPGVEFTTDAGANYLSFAYKWGVNDRTNSVLLKGKLNIESTIFQDGVLLNILDQQYDLSEIRGTAVLNESVDLSDMSSYITTGNTYIGGGGVITNTTNTVTKLLNYPIPANTNIDVLGFTGNVMASRVFIIEKESGVILVDLIDLNATVSSFIYPVDVLFSTHLSATNSDGVKYYNIENTLKLVAKYRGKGLRYADGDIVLLDSLGLRKNVIQAGSIPLTFLQDTTFVATGNGAVEVGTVSIFQPLERGTTYELDFGKEVGFGIQIYLHLKNSALNLNQPAYDSIPAGGLAEIPIRRKIKFKTLEYIDTTLAMVVKLNAAGANYDISDKVKLKKVATEQIISNGIVLSQKIDLSNQNDIVIPKKPEKVYINFIGEWAKVSSTRYMLWMEYLDSNGFYFKKKADTAWQGASSAGARALAKNTKLAIYNSDDSKCSVTIGEWFARKSFHIKVDWVDPSHLRNTGTLKIVDTIYQTYPFSKQYPYRKDYVSTDSDIATRFGSKAKFHIDGIPCVITHNSGFYSLGTFNTNIFLENYMISEDSPNEYLYRGNEGTGFTTANLNKVTFEEVKTNTEGVNISDETFAPMAELITWLNSASSATYKAEFENHFDLNNAIDFYLMMWFGGYWDQVHNNLVMSYTKDGLFRFWWYDCDVCFDSVGGGVWVRIANNPNFDIGDNGSRIWGRFRTAFSDQINTRYAELRKLGVFTVENVEKQFGSINDAFTYEERLNDLTAWFNRPLNTSVLETGFTGMSQILDWTQKRLVVLDKRFNYTA